MEYIEIKTTKTNNIKGTKKGLAAVKKQITVQNGNQQIDYAIIRITKR